MLKASGERLTPDDQRDELVYAEHLARYRWAAQLAGGRRVLDAGCGDGYGTVLLQDAGASAAVGLDIDHEAVDHAKERYGLQFRQGDICALPFPESSFDLVVCFETIEHLAEGSQAVAEFRRVLGSDGLLVISTPNSAEYLVDNEFHEREYTPREFDQLLAEQFDQRSWLYQQNWLLSAILDERQLALDDAGSPLEVELVKAAGIEPGRELYSIVICGPLERVPVQVAVASGVYEANRLAADVLKAEEQRLAWQERSTKAERQREAWEERAAKAEDNAEAWERRAHEVEKEVAELVDGIRAIEASLSWRITTPLRALKDVMRRR